MLGSPLAVRVPVLEHSGLPKATPSRRKKVPVNQQYVGIDLHRRRSVIVRKNAEGEVLSKVHIDNEPVGVGRGGGQRRARARRWSSEATFGWVRHEAPFDRAGGRSPPSACRSRPGKLEAA